MFTLFLSGIFIQGIWISCTQSQKEEPLEVVPENLNDEQQILVKEGFVNIPKGEIALDKDRRNSNGSTPDEISLQHRIMVAKTEVTQKEFQSILGWNPSYFGGCGTPCSTFSSSDEDAAKDATRIQDAYEIQEELHSECFDVGKLQEKECGPNCPVENISLYDAIQYTNQLSEKNSLSPCFLMKNITCTDGTKAKEPSVCMNNNQRGIAFAEVSLAASNLEACVGYRLLSSEEWEFVARAGSALDLPATKDNVGFNLREMGCEVDSNLDKIAIYGGNSRGMPHDVATKQPNNFGLYDILGNVWEWVYDPVEYDFRNPDDPDNNQVNNAPQPKHVEGDEFKIMGGSWLEFASYCRIGEYSSMSPGDKDPSTGFRVAITIPQDPKEQIEQ